MDVIIHTFQFLTRTLKKKPPIKIGGFFRVSKTLFNEQQLVRFRVIARFDDA
jgi:hypothetical protein